MLKLRQSIEAYSQRFNNAIREANDEVVARQLFLDKKRWLCKNDLYYLCCITGNEKIAMYPEFYKSFCDEVSLMNWQVVRLGIQKPNSDMLKFEEVTDNLDDLVMQRLYLCYRTFYKTTIITKVHSLQLLLNFPNIHICLAHNKQENSSDNLVTVKNYFLTTEIRNLFPEYIPKGKDWGNMSGFSVATRKDWSRSEENIEAVGVDTEITGRHYQIAKKNDLVTEKSVNTEEQLKKSLDWDERFNIGMFDDPQTPLQDYEGTRYHFADLYSAKKNDPRIKIFEVPLVRDMDKFMSGEDYITHPERFSRQGIIDLMKDMWVFNCQMQQKPEDPAKMQFKKEMIGYFNSIPQGCNFYLLVDPASARKKKSDYTVMLLVGIGWFEGRLRKFIIDGIRDKLDPKQRVDKALEFATRWSIKSCGWEAIAFQSTDCFYLEEERRKQRLYFTIEEVKSHIVSKEDRIRGLLPEYAQHQWLWPEKGACVKNSLFDGKVYDLTEDMEYEFMQFPLAEHDDLLDTMTFLNRINTVNPEEIKSIPDSAEMTFGEYCKIKDDRLANLNRNPWARLAIGGRV